MLTKHTRTSQYMCYANQINPKNYQKPLANSFSGEPVNSYLPNVLFRTTPHIFWAFLFIHVVSVSSIGFYYSCMRLPIHHTYKNLVQSSHFVGNGDERPNSDDEFLSKTSYVN